MILDLSVSEVTVTGSEDLEDQMSYRCDDCHCTDRCDVQEKVWKSHTTMVSETVYRVIREIEGGNTT